MTTLHKRLWRMIKATKGQFLATVMIISIGIFTYTALTNAAINLDHTLSDYYRNTHFADIFVHLSSLDEEQAAKLAHDERLSALETRLVFDAPLLTDDDSERVTVRSISVDSNQNTLNQLYLRQGRRPISGNEIIVIDQFAKGRHIALGDQLSLQIQGKRQDFHVVGIASSPEFVYLMENAQTLLPMPDKFGVIFVEKSHLQQISGHVGKVNDVLISLNDPAASQSVIDTLKDTWRDAGVLSAIARQDQLSHGMIHQEIDTLQKASSSVPLIFLLFAGLMLVSMLSRTVKGDRMTIGVLKALGYSNGEIIGHYLTYALAAGLLGGLLGNVLGLALAGGMTKLYIMYFNMPAYGIKIYLGKVLTAMILTALVAGLAGVFGAKAVLKITPADAMRPEPPKQGKKIWLDHHLPRLWQHLSFSWKMVLRHLFREKKKFALVVVGVAMTTSMLLATFWFNDVFESMATRHFTEFMKMDYTVNFTGFQDRHVVHELQKHLDTAQVEGKLELPAELSYGSQQKTISVLGLEPDTRFYQLKDARGRVLTIPSDGIILSANLAQSLHVTVGQQIYLHNLLLDHKSGYVTVTGINQQLLGISAYMALDSLGANFVDKHLINGCYINSPDNLNSVFQEMSAIASVQSQRDIQQMYNSFIGLMLGCVAFLVLFSGLLGFAIIYSTTIMSINERTAEFSTLRVLGYKQSEIFALLLKENALLSLLGLALGVPMGVILIKIVGQSFTSDLYTLNEPVSATSLILALGCSLIFVLIAQLVTYHKIKQMDFIQALKSRIS